MSLTSSDFQEEVKKRKDEVIKFLLQDKYTKLFSPPVLPDEISMSVIGECQNKDGSVWHSYILRGGKSLRPAILLFSCGLVGGDEFKSIPAAASIEVYHTFTLIHDDIIDRDMYRRKEKTVHEFLKDMYIAQGSDVDEAAHLGVSVGIISGDLLQGWSTLILDDLHTVNGINPEIVLSLIRELNQVVTPTLASGQTKDIQYENIPINLISVDDIVKMEEEKTGILYEFAGRAGSMIGLGTSDRENEIVRIISSITNKCGIAFQLQDDILGILGDPEKLGKPVDSDIKEGKRTTIVRYAWENGTDMQKAIIEKYIDLKQKISEEQVLEMKALLIDLNGIQKTKELADIFLLEAKEQLLLFKNKYHNSLNSHYLILFEKWIDNMVNRDF